MKMVELNKDVRNYKEKLIGPFSGREILCLVAGVGLTYLIKTLFFPELEASGEEMSYLVIFCMAPFAAIGWAKPYGMYIEKFVQSSLSTFLAPRVRKYDNGLKRERMPLKKSKPSKNKNLVRFK